MGIEESYAMKTTSVRRLFARYVSQNILGTMGTSFYILVDTVFISIAAGADGITALNLVLPVYGLIYAIGSMIGVGAAIRFSILRARKDPGAESYFSKAALSVFFFGAVFMVLGGLAPDRVVAFMGGDERIVAVGTAYTRTFMLFAPWFMLNFVVNAFVRNDGNPSLAMAATLSSSLFNVLMDYVFMFPMKMGMMGAALATGISPIVGVLVCSLHFLSKKNTLVFRPSLPAPRFLAQICKLGVSAFIGEISSGVTTMVFNFVILRLAGNVGVAAYGVVANCALVAVAVFNGVSNGSQPLLSDFYGKRQEKELQQVLGMGIGSVLVLAFLMLLAVHVFTDPLIAMFNSEHSAGLAVYANVGLRLYFIGFIFAGFNIVGTGYLSATAQAGWAFAASVMRGFVAIVGFAFVLPMALGMTGVWLAFPAAELATAVVTGFALVRQRHLKAA